MAQEIKQQLKDLKDLLDDQIIDEAEFVRRRDRLMDQQFDSHSSNDPFSAIPDNAGSKNTVFTLSPDDEIGPDDQRYILKKIIGQGGMGQVWLARDLQDEAIAGGRHESYKALKVLPPELLTDKRAKAGLMREAQRASRLNHSGVVNVLGLREDPQRRMPFLIMEALQGHDLDEELAQAEETGKEGVGWDRMIEILQSVAKTLDDIYDEYDGLIHRDLKPGNIYITEAGKIKVLDFGLAYQLRRSSQRLSKETTDNSSGTPDYMPPETFAHSEPDRRQDVYALACIGYELLTGSTPYPREAVRERPRNLFPNKPASLEETQWEALKTGMAYNREDRPETAVQLVDLLTGREAVDLSRKKEVRKEPVNSKLKGDRPVKDHHPERMGIWGIPVLLGLMAVLFAAGYFAVAYAPGFLPADLKQWLNQEEYESYLKAEKAFQAQNYNAALAGLKKGDRLDIPEARAMLALMYFNGWGVPENRKEAGNYARKALPVLKEVTNQNDAETAYLLGSFYADGIGTAPDGAEAIKWLQIAAEQGKIPAMGQLGGLYHDGRLTTRDYSKAFYWYRLAAEHEFTPAYYRLAELYQKGEGTDRNPKEALRWYRKSAELGRLDSQYRVAQAYDKGVVVKKDPEEAFKWFLKAAEQGQLDSQYRVALAYSNGEAVEKSEKEAFGWYLKAAEQGQLESQYQVAQAYAQGRGVKKDANEAFRWYLKAAEQGRTEAEVWVAKAYTDGTGVKTNPEEAFQWNLKLADKGFVKSQYQVAKDYAEGEVVERDFQVAFDYYKMASKKGDSRAQYALGKLYESGQGVGKNYEKAMYWYERAAVKGNTDAKKAQVRLANKINPPKTKIVKKETRNGNKTQNSNISNQQYPNKRYDPYSNQTYYPPPQQPRRNQESDYGEFIKNTGRSVDVIKGIKDLFDR